MSRRAEQGVAVLLASVAAVGPWTMRIGQVMGLAEFEQHSVIEMALSMVRRVPQSFYQGAPFFIVVPLVIVLVRAGAPRILDAVALVLVGFAMIVSVAGLPLLFLDTPVRSTHNVMGDVFAADLVTFWVWHAFLCYDAQLPAWSLAGGPLFGLGLYLVGRERAHSVAGGALALYLNVGALYRGYEFAAQSDQFVFAQTVSVWEWYGYELYAAATVVLGFLLVSACTPVPRDFSALAETVLYVILLNGNVAAAWVAAAGVCREALVQPYHPKLSPSITKWTETIR